MGVECGHWGDVWRLVHSDCKSDLEMDLGVDRERSLEAQYTHMLQVEGC